MTEIKTKTYLGISKDHSASMRGLEKAAINDYNKTIAGIRTAALEHGDDTIISVVKNGVGVRSAVVDEVINSSVTAIPELNEYIADGHGTPLFDSVGRLIELFESVPDYNSPNVAFVVIVITDGFENCSSKWPSHKLSKKIKELQNTDKWTFIFRVPKGNKRNMVHQLNLFDGNVLEWEQTTSGLERSSAATVSGFSTFYGNKASGVYSSKGFYTTDLTQVTTESIKAELIDVSAQVSIWPVDQDHDGAQIRPFCIEMSGKPMLKGAAFYRLDKKEREVQDYKLIAIVDKSTGAIYIGPAARQLLGLPEIGMIGLNPGDHANYDVYIQSTSINRKLKAGTSVLYWPQIGTAFKS